MTPTFTVDSANFGKMIAKKAALIGSDVLSEFKKQGVLLGRELMQRTPPFSGKAIFRMISARGATANLETLDIAEMTARQVGTRRVEKDIRKVILGTKNAETDWGIRQRCEGREAIRIFADKGGRVYGVDVADFDMDASESTMRKHHDASRLKRGRVSSVGQKTRDVGRWRWLNLLVTQEKKLREYIKTRQRSVGNAKGGWLAGAIACGAKATGGWIGRQRTAGSENHDFSNPYKPHVTFINHSRWATSGDPDGVMAKSLAGREKALAGDIERVIKKQWGT